MYLCDRHMCGCAGNLQELMNWILFDDDTRYRLLPFTHTRPVAEILCGMYTMRRRWELLLKAETSTLTEDYLQGVFPLQRSVDNVLINAAVFGTETLAEAVTGLRDGEVLMRDGVVLAARTAAVPSGVEGLKEHFRGCKTVAYEQPVLRLQHVWDIFSMNDAAIRADFAMATRGRKSAPVPEHVVVSGGENLFIEEGAVINAGCIINASTGPVYVGKDAEMLEGCMVRGPLVVGEHGVLKMGAKIYGATTIGEGSKVGGEVNNAVFFANSNKGHDGFVGNAVIGEWCNLGADTNCSNLKNNYGFVSIWSEHEGRAVPTGLQFCGLLMGDHSKCSINTMFNTGTVVGVSANIFGNGFPAKFVPSYSWGGSDSMTTYAFDKAMDTARRMMARRNRELSEAELAMYRHLFDRTSVQRNEASEME